MDNTIQTELCQRVIVGGGNFSVCKNDKATCPLHAGKDVQATQDRRGETVAPRVESREEVNQVRSQLNNDFMTDPSEDNVCISCQ